jgi:hypothetical protein
LWVRRGGKDALSNRSVSFVIHVAPFVGLKWNLTTTDVLGTR